MDWNELVGKKVKNKVTGVISTVETYAKEPSVRLDNNTGFCVDSLLEGEYEVYEEECSFCGTVNNSCHSIECIDYHWNLKDDYSMGAPKIDSESIEILQEKILEDIRKYCIDLNNSMIDTGIIEEITKDLVKIVVKRIGF